MADKEKQDLTDKLDAAVSSAIQNVLFKATIDRAEGEIGVDTFVEGCVEIAGFSDAIGYRARIFKWSNSQPLDKLDELHKRIEQLESDLQEAYDDM